MINFELSCSNGKRLEWLVPDSVKNISGNVREESDSSDHSFSMVDDSFDSFRRPYDSHVNLVAGRSGH